MIGKFSDYKEKPEILCIQVLKLLRLITVFKFYQEETSELELQPGQI